MWSTALAAIFYGQVLLFAPTAVDAANATAFSLVAGTNWLGDDGSWSTFDFQVGSNPNAQTLSLTVSTGLSEVWVVENTGCPVDPPNPLCTADRGGVYDVHTSNSWSPLGPWQLSVYDDNLQGNGDYGMETISISNRLTERSLTVDNALVAGINDTDFFTGMVGVGATQGSFGDKIANPLISQLAESLGDIPSHSYGYTAGAYYIGSNGGTPASLTLGGYDANRFVPHDVSFNLDPYVRIPQVLMRGIIANWDKAPSKWNSTTKVLASMNESTVALIDTTTAYLWLPEAMCNRFADALDLEYNSTTGLYHFKSNDQYNEFLNGSSLSFTFALSSFRNTDNFGQPFNTRGVVNITISSAAFAGLLKYPFLPTMHLKDPAIPYFPLRRAAANHSIVIGRAFMQEAYLITKYDENSFSIHQALFPSDARSNTSIQNILRSPDSPFPVYEGASSGGLSTASTAGIVIAAFFIGSLVCFAIWWCRRRQRRERTLRGGEDEGKDNESLESESPASPIERILSFIIRRKKSKKPTTHEVDGTSAHPVEVGADAQHELYEMPVPLEPVELDSTNEAGSLGDQTTELGTEGSEDLSPYEIARRKLQRQLQGPVPAYSPPETGEKTEQDISPVTHYRPADDPSPASSPTYGNNSNSFPNSLPSPMTPHGDWTNRFDLPSPMTVAPPFPSPHFSTGSNSDPGSTGSPVSPQTYNPSSMSRSSSSNGSSPSQSLVPPSPIYQRTPIDPSRVICLGPLPENVQLPQTQPLVPRLVAPDGQTVARSAASPEPRVSAESQPRRSTDTLGSNFTVDEENHEQDDVTRQQSVHHSNDDIPRSPNSAQRIDAGLELIHVPQLAARRYSWEDDRS